MPAKVKVKVIAARNLPIMDRSNDTTDAYVELKLGATSCKTDVCKKSLNPTWNTDWFRFEVDDAELQDEPLQIRLMDYDTYSANNSIGKIYIDLNPLLLPRGGFVPKFGTYYESNNSNEHFNSVMSGWIPVYDTLQGIRGEVNIIVKVELFSDFNRYRQSSCGIQFFCSHIIPHGYYSKSVHGFVEELIVKDDPEYQWIDKIRTPRASNEARQFLLFKLYGELQRKIGLKAFRLGGNAVVGYKHYFDLEGDYGIVARGIGTAVTLIRTKDPVLSADANNEENLGSPVVDTTINYLHQRTESVGGRSAQSPSKNISIGTSHRRSSDSDLSITPKGSSLTGSDKSYGHGSSGFAPRSGTFSRTGLHQENLDILDYPFITMTKFPIGFIINFGGVVSARSVKRLEMLVRSVEPESRDSWWNELRLEIRAHTRSLNCNAVLAYTEHATLCEGICVLSATGTAAVIGDINECSSYSPEILKFLHPEEIQKDKITTANLSESPESSSLQIPTQCSLCHLPYTVTSSLLQSTIANKCVMCRSGKVSDVLLSNTEIPVDIPIIGSGCFIQACICRPLKDTRNEPSAKEISDFLPFMEYELHRLLMSKIKIKGMNALFGLKVRISIGARMLVGIATGTGVYLLPLQPLPLPVLVDNQVAVDKTIADMQKLLSDTVDLNREKYKLKPVDNSYFQQLSPDQEVFEDELFNLDPTFENRDYSILEIGAGQRIKDSRSSDQLKESLSTSVSTHQDVLHDCIQLEMTIGRFGFVRKALCREHKSDCLQLWEVDDPQDMEIMNLLLEPHPPDGFHVVNTESVPGLEEIDIVKSLQMFTQIWRSKMQLPYSLDKHVNKLLQSVYFKLRRMIPCALCDLQFHIELPEIDEIQLSVIGMALGFNDTPNILKPNAQQSENEDETIFELEKDVDLNSSCAALDISNIKSGGRAQQSKFDGHLRHGVDITSMSYVPGGRVDRYLGNLNLFFIRESTSVREEGGLSGFIHRFITEVLTIVRSHITALGGNAILAYYMTQCVISHSIHKNQGQCLINVGGDVVFVSYSPEE